MTKLFILDDTRSIREALEDVARAVEIPVVAFESGVKGLVYLRALEAEELPKAYFVDMKIVGGDEELASSERIFDLVKEKGLVDRFYFMTAHLSSHDEKVIARTGAQIMIKERMDIFYRVIGELRNNQL